MSRQNLGRLISSRPSRRSSSPCSPWAGPMTTRSPQPGQGASEFPGPPSPRASPPQDSNLRPLRIRSSARPVAPALQREPGGASDPSRLRLSLRFATRSRYTLRLSLGACRQELRRVALLEDSPHPCSASSSRGRNALASTARPEARTPGRVSRIGGERVAQVLERALVVCQAGAALRFGEALGEVVRAQVRPSSRGKARSSGSVRTRAAIGGRGRADVLLHRHVPNVVILRRGFDALHVVATDVDLLSSKSPSRHRSATISPRRRPIRLITTSRSASWASACWAMLATSAC